MKRLAFIAAAAATGAFAASAGEMVAFTDIDADADGLITEAEFVEYKTIVGDYTEEEAADVFAKIDVDMDGVVTEVELTEAANAWDAEESSDVEADMSMDGDSSY